MNRQKLLLFTIVVILLNVICVFAGEKWKFISEMPTARSGMAAVVFGNKIYVLGGANQTGRVLDVVEIFDPENESWDSSLPALRQERSNGAAVVWHDTLFVIAGKSNEGEVLKKVEFFDIARNQWEGFQDLDEERQGLTAVVLNQTIYAIGGSDEGDHLLNEIEYFDQREDRWKKFQDWRLDAPKASFGSVVVNDSVFSMGGFSIGPSASVQRYHPVAGTAKRHDLHTSRGSLAVTVRRDTIFAIGGRGKSDEVLNSVEIFIPGLNKWENGLPLNTARENCAAVTLANKIYVIGGKDPNGNVLKSVEVLDTITSIADRGPDIPLDFALAQNYPNPFNAGTRIPFRVSSQNKVDHVNLSVYNLTGELVTTLLDGPLPAGEHEVLWQGNDQTGVAVASGIYVYTLQQGPLKLSKKMILVR